MVKNLPAYAGDARDTGLISGLGRSPGGGKWKPTPVSLPGKFHRQRSLVATVHGVTKELDRHDLVTKQQKLHSYQLDQRLSEQLPGLLFSSIADKLRGTYVTESKLGLLITQQANNWEMRC